MAHNNKLEKETGAERLQNIKKFFHNFRKNTLPRIGDFLVDAWERVIEPTLMVIVTIILGVIMFVVLYNWVAYIFWSLIAPVFTARETYKKDFPVVTEIIHGFNGWIVALLPFHCKKYFMEAHGIEHYSVRLQLKYYFRYKRTQETVDQMSPEACRALWLNPRIAEDLILLSNRKDAKAIFRELELKDEVEAYKVAKKNDITIMWLMSNEAIEELCSSLGGMSMTHVYSDIVTAGKKISDDRFAAIAVKCPQLVGEYVLRNTPSDGMMKCLISHEDKFSGVIKFCIRRYGLSPQRILQLRDAELLEKYREDLEIRSCSLFICQHCDPDAHRDIVREFFENTPSIPAPAQKEMELWQLQLFFKMGRELDPDAITHFLSSGESKVVECIFKNLGDTKLTPEQGAIITANPLLTELAVKYGVKYMS